MPFPTRDATLASHSSPLQLHSQEGETTHNRQSIRTGEATPARDRGAPERQDGEPAAGDPPLLPSRFLQLILLGPASITEVGIVVRFVKPQVIGQSLLDPICNLAKPLTPAGV